MIWKSDLGNGRYKNPVLYVDYSDPDAIRVGDDYYLTASSFCNVPGLPILHSKDLVNWKLIGYGLKKIPEFRYREPIHGCGVWAPSIRYHNKTFYIFFPMPDEGIYMIKSTDPAGEWTEAVKLYDGAGFIDPCPFWDEDGNAYLVNAVAKSRIGYKSVLYLSKMSQDGERLLSKPVKIYDGDADGNITTEGPKMYKRNGWYYIFAPAGGVKTGWQIVLRSRNVFGPYEVRTVMAQGDTGVNGPHQGAWVDTVSGEDWFLHFQDVFAAGRIVHLQPMRWTTDDWPVIGEASKGDICGIPVIEYKKPDVRNEVEREVTETVGEAIGKGAKSIIDAEGNRTEAIIQANGKVALSWQWNANPEEEWICRSKDGYGLKCISLSERRPMADYPNLLLRKWEAPEFKARIRLDVSGMETGDYAGIMAMGCTYAGIGIVRETEGWHIRQINGEQIFDRGNIYAKEEEKTEAVTFGGSVVECLYEVIPSNNVTATSKKPEYTLGEEGKVLHPESLIRLHFIFPDRKTYTCETSAFAGRWVGAKYGLFAVHKKEQKEEKCGNIGVLGIEIM